MPRHVISFLLLASALGAQTPGGARCKEAPMADPASGPAWNGWGVDASNARFQRLPRAGITPAQVQTLKLKWAFGFPGAHSVLGQPSIAAGRVFIGVDTGEVYSLDAAAGCAYWSVKAEAGVRTAITISSGAQPKAYFGDL
jgi:polyvinyl alcohol dehydrogenase (cytochrome)